MSIINFLRTLLFHRRIIENQKLQIQIMASWLNDYADNIKHKNAIDEFLTINNLRR